MNLNYLKIGLLTVGLFFYGTTNAAEKKQRKAVFVIVDGISEDMLSKTATPFMDYIANKGGLIPAYIGGGKDTYTQTPTISAVGYNSLLTGTWVNKHNVFGNGIEAPNYNYPTLFRLVESANPDFKTAVFSTWEDNRTKLIGEGLSGTDSIVLDYAFDGLELDKRKYPHDNNSEYIKEIDQAVANRAAEYIAKYGPDISWVYLQYTDDMGHKYGDSKQMYDAITFEDALIGQVYQAVEEREKNFNEEWLFVVTTDHGRSAETGKGHGGQSDRERNIWILSNQEDWAKNTQNFKPSIVDIAPSITEFMQIDVPVENQMEWDGNSMYNEVKIKGLTGTVKGNKLSLNWSYKNLAPKTTGEVWVATTNNLKEGGSDEYVLLDTVDLDKGKASLKVKPSETGFYKVYIKSNVGNLNTWIF